jgi:hypothetical protein
MSSKVMCVQLTSTGVLSVSSVVIYRRSSSLHECIPTIAETHCSAKARIDSGIKVKKLNDGGNRGL